MHKNLVLFNKKNTVVKDGVKISDIQIKMIYKYGTAMSFNTFSALSPT